MTLRNTTLLSLSALVAGGLCLTGTARAESHVKAIKITLQNSVGVARPNEPISLSIPELKRLAPDFNAKSFLVMTSDAATVEDDAKAIGARQIASQADDLDGDGQPDEVAFEMDFAPHARKVVTINYGDEASIAPMRLSFPQRAHAAYHQKYEGMGWESDRVAWRMYFDQRNAFDMYGKHQHCMALEYFALPGVNYHAESPIGRDTYKIGEGLGIGSVGAWVDGKAVKVGDVADRKWKVISDGPVRAIADLIYTGWNVAGRKVDITSRITVWAGQHWFEHAITARNAEGLTIVASLPRKPANEVQFLPTTSEPYYMATWGKQVLMPGATAVDPLPNANMGLAVIVPGVGPQAAAGLNDPANWLVRPPMTPANGALTSRWRVFSAWDQESPDGDSVPGLDPALTLPNAVNSAEGWERYVNNQASLVAHPVSVRIAREVAAAAGPEDTLGPVKPKTYAQAIDLMRQGVDRTAQQFEAASKKDNHVYFMVSHKNDGEWAQDKGFGWTGSFWVGELWNFFQRTHDPKYATWARTWNEALLGHEGEENHDTGFLNYYSSARAYDITHEAKYRDGALRAAAREKELFNPKTGLVAAWTVNGDDSIIDTMMNLNILWWAAKTTGDPSWLNIGRQHALKSAQWLVRPDGSIIQSVHYDPATGRRRFGHTHQGFGDETSWGRGTGWGLYGFTIAARETKDPAILATAEKIAGFVVSKTPDDGVAWHDYCDEGIDYRVKDTSAAALAANGLLNLSELTKDPAKAATYRATGIRIVNGLIDRYLTPVGDKDTVAPGVLRHGSGARPADQGLIFGDYYLLEALTWLEGHGVTRA